MRTLTLARRELMSYVLSPTGYIIAAIFMLFTAVLYFMIGAAYGGGFNQGEPASLQLFFSGGIWVFLFVAPAISMRTMSDEYRLGTIETLLTSPIREYQVVLGKFLGSFAFLALMLVPTLIYLVALETYGRPDYGQVMCGYGGMLLAGGSFLATGLFFSALTASQVLAYLATLFFWLILLMATKGLPVAAAIMESRLGSADREGWQQSMLEVVTSAAQHVAAADPQRAISDFAAGLVDSFNIVFFLSFIIVSLVAATSIVQTRRWQ